jgi:hypothetical protein
VKPLKPLKVEVPKTRDWLMVKVINGVTKAGVAKDRRKEANRLASRRWRPDREDR